MNSSSGLSQPSRQRYARLKDIPEELSRRRACTNHWAPIEILGHLIDSAANNHQRFVRGAIH
jgi:hypothetical protein